MAPNKQALTRESVSAAALAFIDRAGLDALSMRTLASELGVTAMALYRYFPTKAALLEAVLDRVMAEVTRCPQGGETWEDRVSQLIRSFRRILLAHPNVVPVLVDRPPTNEDSLRLFEYCLSVLHSAGFPDTVVARAYFTLFTYALGFVATEVARSRSQPAGVESGVYPYRPVPPEEFPLVTRLTPQIEMLGDEQFEFGLSTMLIGLGSIR